MEDVHSTEHLQCWYLHLGVSPLVVSGESGHLWAAIPLILKWSSDRSDEWCFKRDFPLSALAMK